MRSQAWSAPLAAALVMFLSRPARAECTKDVECKEARICVEGACVDPPPRAPEPAASTPVASVAPAAPRTGDVSPRTERRSTALMVTGIVSLSLVPFAFGVMTYGMFQKSTCNMHTDSDARSRAMGLSPLGPPQGDCSRFDGTIYGGGATSLALLGGGIAMLVLGIQKVPVETPTALRVRPWLGRDTAGLGFHAAF